MHRETMRCDLLSTGGINKHDIEGLGEQGGSQVLAMHLEAGGLALAEGHAPVLRDLTVND